MLKPGGTRAGHRRRPSSRCAAATARSATKCAATPPPSLSALLQGAGLEVVRTSVHARHALSDPCRSCAAGSDGAAAAEAEPSEAEIERAGGADQRRAVGGAGGRVVRAAARRICPSAARSSAWRGSRDDPSSRRGRGSAARGRSARRSARRCGSRPARWRSSTPPRWPASARCRDGRWLAAWRRRRRRRRRAASRGARPWRRWRCWCSCGCRGCRSACPAAFLLWEGPLEGVVWAVALAGVAWRRVRCRARLVARPAHVVGAASGAVDGRCCWRRRSSPRLADGPAAGARGRRAALSGHHAEPAPRRRSRASRTTIASDQYLEYYDGGLKPDFMRRGIDRPDLFDSRARRSRRWCCRPSPSPATPAPSPP